ncbi:hypothetical protein J6590_027811 [Homalodisca vitripennis]|nr:hypothetical protein J6590_027811 [Homalodisca vitripennis]
MEDCLGLYKRISRSQLVSSDKDGRLPRIVQTDIPFTRWKTASDCTNGYPVHSWFPVTEMEDCLGLYKRISRSQLVSSDRDGRLPRIVQTDIPFTVGFQ